MMKKKEKQLCIFVLYDSITNSVFESQVVRPLQKMIQQNPYQAWHIVSFEKEALIPPTIDGIALHILKRSSYINSWSLWPAVKQMRAFLKPFKQYTIVARGPFAGYIALHATTTACQQITIQARGLAGQEYAYTHKHNRSLFSSIRAYLLNNLERIVYSTRHQLVTIEAVSPALQSYLIATYHACADKITLAQHDIPSVISHEKRELYRTTIRAKLHIDHNTTVYCYNGSYASWQCPQQTIEYFKQQLAHHKCFLLILTPDVKSFAVCATTAQLPQDRYLVCSVTQNELYQYLAAADFGILFREPHIINTVSRPTKALEYHAARLHVLHNGTVDFISRIPAIDHSIMPFADRG